jgi:hypothetical protein
MTNLVVAPVSPEPASATKFWPHFVQNCEATGERDQGKGARKTKSVSPNNSPTPRVRGPGLLLRTTLAFGFLGVPHLLQKPDMGCTRWPLSSPGRDWPTQIVTYIAYARSVSWVVGVRSAPGFGFGFQWSMRHALLIVLLLMVSLVGAKVLGVHQDEDLDSEESGTGFRWRKADRLLAKRHVLPLKQRAMQALERKKAKVNCGGCVERLPSLLCSRG